MAWARLDDGWHDHPKVVAAGLEAAGLWTMCLTWAHKNRRKSPRPGFVPKEVASRFAAGKAARLGRKLVEVGLFDVTDGGWLIHDFTEYLPKYDPAQAAEAGRKGAAARWDDLPDDPPPDDEPPYDRDGKPPPEPHGEPMARADAPASARRNPVPVPTPTTSRDLRSNAASVDAREHTLAGSIVVAYAAGVPLSDHGRALRVIGAALDAGYDPELIRRGIGVLIAEQRSCTLDTLRIAMHTDEQPAQQGRRRTATEKASQWLTVGTDEDPPPLRALPGGLA